MRQFNKMNFTEQNELRTMETLKLQLSKIDLLNDIINYDWLFSIKKQLLIGYLDVCYGNVKI